MDLTKETVKKLLWIMVFAAFLLTLVLNIESVLNGGSYIMGLLTPLMIGGAMAFILNVIMKWLESKVLGNLPGKLESMRRGLALIISLIIVFGLVAFLLLLVIPELVNTIEIVSDKLPDAFKRFEKWWQGVSGDLPVQIPDLDIDWNQVINWITDFLEKGSSAFFKSTIGITSSIFGAFFNGLLGLVFAIYLLLQKETLGHQLRKLLFAFLKPDNAEGILAIGHRAHHIFSNFVTGQFTEALIIGVLCFTGMLILSMPYALVISALVGFTALIPVFGAFIGTGIGAFLILMVSPMKALWFIVFILVLQQLEGNLIYPKVVGSSIGLPGIWVLAAVTIGGSAFGILGMLVGVPLVSLIYSLLRDFVNLRLKQKNRLINR